MLVSEPVSFVDGRKRGEMGTGRHSHGGKQRIPWGTALRVSRVWMVKEAMLITSPVIIVGARDLTNFGHKQSVRLGLTLAGAQEVEQVVGAASLFTKEKTLTARGLDGDFCLEDMGGSQLPKFMGQFT